MTLWVGLERRAAVDGKLGNEGREFASVRPQQQRADEERVPGELRKDACLHSEFRVGASAKILRVQRLAVRVRDEVLVQARELRRRHLAVVFPPDGLVSQVVADDILVLRTASGMYAGFGAERAAGRELSFSAGEGTFVQFRL